MIFKFIGIFWHRWRANRIKKRIKKLQVIYDCHVDELYIYASIPDENISTAAKMSLVQVEAKGETWDGTL